MSVNKLTKENKKKYKKILEKKKIELEETLTKQLDGSIKNQIEVNKDEIKDIGIIVCAFDNQKAPLNFIRTEPLFSFKEKNFDVLLYGKKTMILVSVKDSLVSNPVSKIKELKQYSQQVEDNIEISNPIEDKKMKILEYFQTIIKKNIDFKEYVLSSQKVHIDTIRKSAISEEYNFCLWQLLEKNAKLFLIYYCINGKEDEKKFVGHRDSELREYLHKLSSQGEVYTDPLTFIYSSSRYLKAISISIPLFMIENNDFDYIKWCKRFKTDLMNWHEEEKETIFRNYIEYGIRCKFIRCIEDKKDIFLNRYSIISRHSKTALLQRDLISKIVKCEVCEEIKKEFPKLKKQIISDLLIEQAKEKKIRPLKTD